MRVSVSRTVVPVDLKPPQAELTQQQQFFAGAHLQSLSQFQTRADGRLDMRWKVDGKTGSRRLGP